MTLSPQWLDELRARTTLSAVIGPSVKLIKAGREFKACCPFHNEKTPSFTINDEKGFYHCFGCGAHGDAIRFLTDQRGMPFMDAVRELAGKAGLDLPEQDPRERDRAEKSKGLHDVTAAAQAFFAEALDGIEGGAARDYLKKRGLGADLVRRFGLGFAPDSRGKLKAALTPAFGEQALIDTGMLIQPDEGGRDSYDRFRGRLMIPIRDVRGRVIAFGGRILGAGEPKYLNSPETLLFDKGRTLYNLDRASPASRKAGRVLVVEGYMDVIALDKAGIAEAVAPLGTALTEDQIQRLWRLDPAPICCFDGDAAGQKAAVRAALRALPHLGPERTLRFLALPEGKDPDDVVRAGGRAAMEELLAAPEPLVDRLWRHEVAAGPLDTPEARAGLKQRLFDHVAAIQDPNVRQLYRDEWLRRFDALVRPGAGARDGGRDGGRGGFGGRRDWKKGKDGRWAPPPPPPGDVARAVAASGIDGATARAVLTGFVNFPEEIAGHVELLAALPLPDAKLAGLRERLIDASLAGGPLDRGVLLPMLEAQGLGSTAKALLRARGLGYSFTRTEGEDDRARRDLGAVLDAIIASGEAAQALARATERLGLSFSESGYAEQQRLVAQQQAINEHLAKLAGNE